MYQKPDFIKISVRAADVFASNGKTGCAQDQSGTWTYTQPCEGTDEYKYVENTFTELGWGHQCYTSQNP